MAELEEAAPAYILVNDQALESMVVHHYPALATEVSALPSRLGRRYQKFRTDAGGTWYSALDLAPRSSVQTIQTNQLKPLLWSNVLALGLVVLAGGVCLSRPFWGDQALFTVYAHQLTDGAVLYRDVFDVKQPGIFLFYALGGLLFGFSEVGIHLFELLYWIGFSAFALVALRPYFTTRWAPSLVPVFTVVAYLSTRACSISPRSKSSLPSRSSSRGG